MKTRLEEVNELAVNAERNLVLIALGDHAPDTIKSFLETYVQLRIEKAMIEKGYVHG